VSLSSFAHLHIVLAGFGAIHAFRKQEADVCCCRVRETACPEALCFRARTACSGGAQAFAQCPPAAPAKQVKDDEQGQSTSDSSESLRALFFSPSSFVFFYSSSVDILPTCIASTSRNHLQATALLVRKADFLHSLMSECMPGEALSSAQMRRERRWVCHLSFALCCILLPSFPTFPSPLLC